MLQNKLYPPYLEGKTAAFTLEQGLKITFKHSPYVGISQIKGYSCKISTVNNQLLGVFATSSTAIKLDNYMSQVIIHINSETQMDTLPFIAPQPGVYYKIALAYIDQNDEIGYYSDISITKCTIAPEISILGLTSGINLNRNSYIGCCDFSNGDVTESIYSYQFIITDSDNNCICDSNGFQLHKNNLTTNNLYEIRDEFIVNKELKEDELYYIQYSVITTNGLICQSPRYMLQKSYNLQLLLPSGTGLSAIYVQDSGYIKVALNVSDEYKSLFFAGKYKVSRASSEDNYMTWHEICQFELINEHLNRDIIYDYTVIQGLSYQYALQQYNDYGIISSKLLSEKIYVDYEDMFLSDGTHQLKVRFNANISTYKPTILEQKIDTIGSQYPFIFRNGIVNYKEFALTGLISYLMDTEQLFLNDNGSYTPVSPREATPAVASNVILRPDENFSTDLTAYNIMKEREFKTEVLNWLTNGKPKLLRTATEGAFIVQLMNVSLSPNTQLGRMLHTFQCTAYEIAAYSMENLIKYNLIPEYRTADAPTDMTFATLNLKNYLPQYTRAQSSNSVQDVQFLMGIPREMYKVQFTNLAPGSQIGLRLANQAALSVITIGATGNYFVPIGIPVTGIALLYCPQFPQNGNRITPFTGEVTYGYFNYIIDKRFELISNFTTNTNVLRLYGANWHNQDDQDIFNYFNLNNLQYTIGHIYSLRFSKREQIFCYIHKETINNIPYYCFARSAHEVSNDIQLRPNIDLNVPLYINEILPECIYVCKFVDTNTNLDGTIHYLDGYHLLQALSNIEIQQEFKNDAIFMVYANNGTDDVHFLSWDTIARMADISSLELDDYYTIQINDNNQISNITLNYDNHSFNDNDLIRSNNGNITTIEYRDGRYLLTDINTANYFSIQIGPLVQIDCVLSVNRIDYTCWNSTLPSVAYGYDLYFYWTAYLYLINLAVTTTTRTLYVRFTALAHKYFNLFLTCLTNTLYEEGIFSSLTKDNNINFSFQPLYTDNIDDTNLDNGTYVLKVDATYNTEIVKQNSIIIKQPSAQTARLYQIDYIDEFINNSHILYIPIYEKEDLNTLIVNNMFKSGIYEIINDIELTDESDWANLLSVTLPFTLPAKSIMVISPTRDALTIIDIDALSAANILQPVEVI